MKGSQLAHLKFWSKQGDMLVGVIQGHQRIKDNTLIVTSEIKELDLEYGVCITRGTVYSLGSEAKDAGYINTTKLWMVA